MQTFIEHRVPRLAGSLVARDYPGAGPAFVLMHGFPDHMGIYDELVPYLTAAGRRVVTFDFLGFGRSDKNDGVAYGFGQQLADLEAVVDALSLETIVPVVHDSSGPAGVNFCLAHREKVASLVILNSAYDDRAPTLWPEMITLFATPALAALGRAIAQSPAQFGWLLSWQQARFTEALPEDLRAHFAEGMGKLIADNFTVAPSSGPAFLQLAAGFFDELARNAERLPEVAALDLPVKVIWGRFDPYIAVSDAEHRAAQFRHASLRILPGGHWLQSDVPDAVAAEMLS